MQHALRLQHRALCLIEQLRQRLVASDFCARHRRRGTDFTRQRRLTFPVLMLLVLQKSLKSLQAHLHEFLSQLAGGAHAAGLSGGALTHARAKLRASAFAELNQIVQATVYEPEHADLVPDPANGTIAGTLANIVYFGTDTHYHVKLDGGGENFIVRHQNSRSSSVTFATGAKVGIQFEEDAARVLKD